jgi:hypothetical protein
MASEAIKLEREKRRTAREERLSKILLDPQMMGLLTLLGGLYLTQRIPFSDNEERNDLIRGLATGGVVLTAISRAGVTGWPALAAAGLSGAASAGGGNDKPIIQLDWSGFWKNITGGS